MSVDYKLIFESLPGMYYVLTPDFKIAAVSDVFLKSTMTSRESLIGKYLFDIFPENPEESEARGESSMRASLAYVLDHKQAHTMAVLKYDIRTPDGEYDERYWSPMNQPVLGDAKDVLYIIHQVKDITDLMHLRKGSVRQQPYRLKDIVTENEAELFQRGQEIQRINTSLIQEIADRRIAEAKAQAAQTLLQATIESHKDILIFSIDRNYRFLVFNTAFQASTFQAYGTRVVSGASMLECFTVEADRTKAVLNCNRALAGENHVTVEQYGDSQRYFFETRYTPIKGHDDVIVGVTVQSANVTERKVAEEQVRILNQELESFTYSVAHDLRAPLRAIDGYTQILREELGDKLDAEVQRLLTVVTNNAKMMGKLIDDLLHFSRIAKLTVRHHPVDMNYVVNTVMNEEFFFQDNTRVRFKIGFLEPVRCDASLIRQVITNLISNAIKYSRHVPQPEVIMGSIKKESEAVYYIRDNGVGFDMAYTEKLFGVFQRLHKASEFEGTGVGLAIVQRIVTKHGGKVWAESEVGKGATFYFSLPL